MSQIPLPAPLHRSPSRLLGPSYSLPLVDLKALAVSWGVTAKGVE